MKKITITIATILGLISINANAGTSVGSAKSTATLSSSCQFSASDVVFGDYNPFATDHQQTTQNVTYKCNKGVAFSIWTYAPNSTTLSGYGVATAMTAPGTSDKLYYQVLESQVNSTYWNEDMNIDSESYKSVGTGTFQNVSFLYRIIKNQAVTPANYSATQTMTFKF